MRFYFILIRLTKISLGGTYFQIGKDVRGKKMRTAFYENVKNYPFSRCLNCSPKLNISMIL